MKVRIQRQATILFLRYGIKGVSMDDIAAALFISKKTLYKFFATKDELVQAMLSEQIALLQETCLRTAARAANAVELLVELAHWSDQQLNSVHASVLYDLKKYHPVAWDLLQTHKNTFVLEQLSAYLHRGVAEGLFRPGLDVDVLARLRLGQIDLLLDPERFPPAEFTASRVGMAFDEHFIMGLATPHGQQLYTAYRNPQAVTGQLCH